MSGKSEGWAYTARTPVATKRHPANTVVCAAVDGPGMAKSNAKDIAAWIRDGLTIERVPIEWVRKYLFTQEPYRPGEQA